jgi:CubicO group peptidase (beta-lactamase class C family)
VIILWHCGAEQLERISKMKALLFLITACVSVPQIAYAGTDEVRHRLEGIWMGSLAIPGMQIRLAYRVSVVGEDSLFVIHDSPDYGHIDIPVHAATFDGTNVRIDISLFDASFRGKVKGERIIGWYRAGQSRIPLNLTRVSSNPRHLLDYMVPRLGPDGELCVEYRYSAPAFRDGGWETAHASDVGIDLRLIDELMNHILHGDYHDIQALLIAKDGKLVLEEYFHGLDAESLHPIYSISKNVIYNTAGVALESGILENPDQPIAEFFPEYERIFAEPGKDEISLGHLVSMTSGLEWDEVSTSYFDPRNSLHAAKASGNTFEYVFSRPLGNAPGVEFEYNSVLPDVLAEIVSRSSGMPFIRYAHENLIHPLRIGKHRWEDGTGVLHLRARDLTKLGYLNTHRGRFLDAQIVPESWFVPSMSDSSICDNPFYWNHWGEEEFFVGGRPVVGYSQGGFGGQLNFGFPDLDLVVTMFAGNYRSGTAVDQHEMVREFILPAVVGTRAEHAPHAGGVPVTAIDLSWHELVMTRVGCLKACLDYFGREFSEAWVFGATGNAFALNIEDNVHSRSVGAWRSAETLRLCENLGVTIETISGHQSQADFEDLQRTAWDKTRAALEKGSPCFGFHLNDFEWYVINGYDRQGYYYQGKGIQEAYGPKCWQELGTLEPKWLEVHIVQPGQPLEDLRVVEAALEFALDIAFSPEKYQLQGFKAGVSAYNQWIRALRENRHDPFGVASNAAVWAECRRNAATFLKEARLYVPDKARPLLKKAQAHYTEVARNLTEVSRLFPCTQVYSFELEANARDRDRQLQAIRYLESARDAEADGLEVLKKVVESI